MKLIFRLFWLIIPTSLLYFCLSYTPFQINSKQAAPVSQIYQGQNANLISTSKLTLPKSPIFLVYIKNQPFPPTGLTVTEANCTSINLSWIRWGTVTGFIIERASSYDFRQGLLTLDTINSSVDYYVDNSVSPGAVYYYRVYATTTNGSSPASYPLQVTVPKNAVIIPVTISNVRIDTDLFRATISWDTNVAANATVEYGNINEGYTSLSINKTYTINSTITLKDLTPNTKYLVRIKTNSQEGGENVLNELSFNTAKATLVSGVLNTNTNWTKTNSPYVITSTFQIPQGFTLTIEPGTTIIISQNFSSGLIFLLDGSIYAHGNATDPITFDLTGHNKTYLFYSKLRHQRGDFDYCIFENGGEIWAPTGGQLSLRHSLLTNLSSMFSAVEPMQIIDINKPTADCTIEYNKFINTGGISITDVVDARVNIKYNLFQDLKSSISFGVFSSNSGTNTNTDKVNVMFNSFIGVAKWALRVDFADVTRKIPVFSTSINARQNYWGTTNITKIDSMIFDGNDDVRFEQITYLPILTQPDIGTPNPN